MKSKAYFLAINAMFIALILLLGLTPLGIIPLGFISLTILHIPVILGAILLGLPSGMILGLSFGLVSLLNLVRAPSGLTGALFAASPAWAVLMCIAPRLLVPLVTRGVYKIAARGRDRRVGAAGVAAVFGTMTNTVFFLAFLYAGYAAAGLNPDSALLKTLFTVAGINGGSEAILAALVAAPVCAAVWKVNRKKKDA